MLSIPPNRFKPMTHGGFMSGRREVLVLLFTARMNVIHDVDTENAR